MRRLGRNDACWCGSGKKYKACHLRLDQTARRTAGEQSELILKTPEQIEGIRRACILARQTLEMVEERLAPGVKTSEIDRWIHDYLLEHGAIPATLGYRNYPKSCCISINEVICHGIPGETLLREGDIVNIDVTSILDGYFGDISRMYCIGEVSEEARRLVRVTRECLDRGIQQVRPGGHLGDIGAAIQQHAEAQGYSVVENIGGHGVGCHFHEEPFVAHVGKRGEGLLLVPGMTFTIEPMVNQGTGENETLADEWTVVTADRKLSAQWEHTIAVTETGVDVLTA